MNTRLFSTDAHDKAQSEAVLIKATQTQRRIRTIKGKRALQQSLLTLVQSKLNELENLLEEIRDGIHYWSPRADKETAEGKEAYQHLNRLKNRCRSLEIQLENWKQRRLELTML
jgi:hypothetical protein